MCMFIENCILSAMDRPCAHNHTKTFVMLFSSRKKKALNKNARFEINPKSVYPSRDKEFDENSVSTGRKKLFPLAKISAKIKKNGFNEQE